MNAIKILVGVSLAFAAAAEWTEPQEVRMRRDHVLTYRAMLAGDTLIIEAVHEEGWHTYAMDNIARAREASGKEKPDCELPTRIEVTGALSVIGPWRQSDPQDLSNTDIKWYTYGFEDTTYFAATVKRGEGEDATVRIDAQACNESKCSMVDGLELTLNLATLKGPSKSPIDLDTLVDVEIVAAD
jgi:hypothetical protein